MERTYDYPAKNGVRDLWMAFLPPHIPNIAGCTGLYLPAPENLEGPGYAAKGFNPAMLIGAEHHPDRAAEVRVAAPGIQLVTGPIRAAVDHAIKSGLPRLTFANLDFEGSYNTYLEDLLSVFRAFPADPAGYLAVTSYAARDDEAIIQGVVNISKFYAGLGYDMSRFFRETGMMMERYKAMNRVLETESRVPDHMHLSRELGFLWWLAVGMIVTAYRDDGYGTRDEAFLSTIEGHLREISSRVLDLGRGTEFCLVPMPELAPLLQKKRCELWPKHLTHIAYHSHGRMKQAMRTWFVEVERIRDAAEMPTAQEVLEQVWQLARRTPLTYIDESGSRITIERGGRP